jgi:hypothetical protein
MVNSQVKQFAFESHKKGWHYEWRGNKYTSDKPHAFVVYLAVPISGGSSSSADAFQSIAVFYSPEFTMFCRRRHKTVPEAEKHLMADPVPEDQRTVVHKLDSSGRIPLKEGLLRLSAPSSKAAARTSAAPAATSATKPLKKQKEKKRVKSPDGEEKVAVERKSKKLRQANSRGDEKKGKLRPDKDGTDLKLVRVLAAIANLDKLKRRVQDSAKKSQQTAVNNGTNPSLDTSSTVDRSITTSPPLMAPADTSMIDDLDMSWLDALAGPLQENFLGSEDFLSFKGNSIVDDIFDLGAPQEVDSQRARAVEVIEALARFLLEEESFTQAIHENATKGGYSDFISIIQKNIGDFLRDRFNGMTIDDLDSALRGESPVSSDSSTRKEMKSAFETLVSAALMRDADEVMDRTAQKIHSLSSSPSSHTTSSNGHKSLGHEDKTEENKPLDIQLPPGISMIDFLRPPCPLRPEDDPDVAGVWIRPDSNTVEMEKWRERREMDWVQRQLLARMEKRFDLEQPSRGQVVVKLSRKLLSSGVVTYYLDGVERPFPLASPLGPAGMLAKSYVGWAVGPCACFRNQYSDTERLIRCNWKVGEDELHGVHIYQSRGGAWVSQTQPQQDEEQQQMNRVSGSAGSMPAATNAAEFNGYPVTEDGWKVVHITTQICTRDKTVSSSSRFTSTSSEAEDL